MSTTDTPEQRERKRQQEQARYRRNAVDIRDAYFLRTYGLTRKQYDDLIEAQGHRCALCGRGLNLQSTRAVHVDHDHETGRVRGILCVPCNAGLGMLGDTVEGLRRAIAYLETH